MKWFIGIVLLLAVALVLESGLLAYAGYTLLGLLLISRFLARQWTESLSAARQCKTRTAEIGDTVTVQVEVHNAGWLPVPWVLLEDLLPKWAFLPAKRLKVQGKRIQLCKVPAHGKTTLKYRLTPEMRGYYQIGPVMMESGDLFGLHRRFRVATQPHFLLVYPRVVPLEGYEIASRRPIGEVRLTHRLFEDPSRIAGVREYQAGDPLNRVHWPSTARTGQLQCKVYEPTTMAGATILLDFHQAGYFPQGEPHRSELAVTAAVSLANALYVMGQPFGLITNGRDAADRIRLEGWETDYRTRPAARDSAAMQDKSERLQPVIVPTSRGVEQFQHIRETLARVELTDGLTFAELIAETAGRIPRDTTVLALLPDAPTETALALGSLHRRGFAVTAVLLLLDDNALHTAYGRLWAEGIRDVRHLKDEQQLANLCRQQVQWMSPYALATEF